LAWHARAPAIEYRKAHADITYVYDALGRLVGVVDPAGDTGVYQYDAVGNLTGIARYASSTVGIIAVTQGSGPAGTLVTISGTAFSATPGQNTVTFNGISATVISSTTTQIIVTVPTGVTSGPIVVTSPAGAATSATPFTVSGSGAPTITSFTPNVGAATTAVTITGTNFESVPTNNRLNFYVAARALVGSASTTTLSATVPVGATSGRLTIAHPAGVAQSGDDFFVPPLDYPASAVIFTDRIAIGGSSVVVALGTASKIGLVVFDGTAGQTVSLGIPQIPTSGWDSDITIFRPDGGTVVWQFIGYGNWIVRDVHIPSLPATGTYTILVNIRQSYGTGNFTLSLSEDLAPVPLTVGGSPLVLPVSRPAQRTPLTFSGTTGQRLSLGVASSLSSRVTIVKPDGTPLISDWSEELTVNLPPLPATGTYTVYLDPYGASTGTMTVTLLEEVAGTITIGGAPIALTLPQAGQRARLSFSGTAGQRLNLGLTDSTILTGNGWVIHPDGSTVAFFGFGGGNNTLDIPPLPVTGTYVILIDPYGSYQGDVTLALSAEFTGTIIPGGSAVVVSITQTGQQARLSFSGTEGQRVSITATDVTIGESIVTVINPDGSTLGGAYITPSYDFVGIQTLPTTGTYAILVDPVQTYTGTATLTVYDVPADVTGWLVINDPATSVSLAVPGQQAALTIAATANQEITFEAINSTLGCLEYAVAWPGIEEWYYTCESSFWVNKIPEETATYTLRVYAAGSNTGSIDLRVTSP
jgi:YD repeat-containing protein